MITEFRGKYRWLSNFWLCPVILEGFVYPTVENAYQASKTLDLESRIPFVTCSPGKAAYRGRNHLVVRLDWEDVKLKMMRKLLDQKFQFGTFKATQLLATGDKQIVEGNIWGDTFWGVCNGVGTNHLGIMLMDIRKKLLDV